jgi:hypothetical protein
MGKDVTDSDFGRELSSPTKWPLATPLLWRRTHPGHGAEVFSLRRASIADTIGIREEPPTLHFVYVFPVEVGFSSTDSSNISVRAIKSKQTSSGFA